MLKDIISENQYAFIPDRAISDNVLITHEMLHYLKTSGATVHTSMAVKTDISKAYDRLEWPFIQAVLERLGFHQTWIKLIMTCITTVSYSFGLSSSAMWLLVASLHNVEYVRETPSPHTSSYSVERYSRDSAKELKSMEQWQG